MLPEIPFIDRAALGRVFLEPRTLLAFEGLQQAVTQTYPTAINTSQQTADEAVAANAATQSAVDVLSAAAFVVTNLSGALSAERLLLGGVGVSIDVSVASAVRVLVDALVILNAAAINLTQPVDVQNSLRCDSLRIDATPAATATASDHSIPIDCNGVTYYMRLSTAP